MRSAALSAHPSFGRLAAVGSLLAHLMAAALLLVAVHMREPVPDAPEQAVEMMFEAPPAPTAPAPAPEPQAVTAPDTPPPSEPAPPPEPALPSPPDEPAPLVTPPVEAPPPTPADVPAPPPIAEQPPVAPPVDPSAPTAPPSADMPAPPPAAEPPPVPPPLVPLPARPAPVTPRSPPPRPLPPRPTARRAAPNDASPPVAALPPSRPPAAQPPAAVPAPQPSPAPVAEVSPAWRGALSAWVQSHRVYPAAARAAGQEGRVGIRFTVDRNGRVLSAQVVSSSGSSLLDEGARGLLASAQLPPFPQAMPQPQQTVVLGIQYNLER